MAYYSAITWTIKQVADAFNNKSTTPDGNGENNNKIVIPVFQRGLRWDKDKRELFIDSLERGYPFGSLLLSWQGKQGDINVYSVVDGLQRGSTVSNYVSNPLGDGNLSSIDDRVLDQIRKSIHPGNEQIAMNKNIERAVLDYLHEKKQFDKIVYTELTKKLVQNFPTQEDLFTVTERIEGTMRAFLEQRKAKYTSICDAVVPIVLYDGPQEYLSEVFKRINREGIKLNDYEIYAATWGQKKYKIRDKDVLDSVVKKYLTIISAGYEIQGFDAQKILTEKKLTAFEYLFGLGKKWTRTFDCLKFEDIGEDDEVSEVSFEIVDACLNPQKSIYNLHIRLDAFDIDKLQSRIEEAIKYVEKSINIIGKFKGNKRKFNVLHSKYQIISLISYTFLQMYDPSNLDTKLTSWAEKQNGFSHKLLSHYVSDIITNEWHDGGGQKVYQFIKDRRYDEDISQRRWEQILDNYYQTQLANKQRKQISNPVNADSIILNCIYVDLFTAGDQVSDRKFDIEHIATKERMKKLMNPIDDLRLPVSCVANLCYLPEGLNRGKREKTIYEVDSLRPSINEIEEKYTFTKENDLEWILKEYQSNQGDILAKKYQNYLEARYKIMKKKFLAFFKEE